MRNKQTNKLRKLTFSTSHCNCTCKPYKRVNQNRFHFLLDFCYNLPLSWVKDCSPSFVFCSDDYDPQWRFSVKIRQNNIVIGAYGCQYVKSISCRSQHIAIRQNHTCRDIPRYCHCGIEMSWNHSTRKTPIKHNSLICLTVDYAAIVWNCRSKMGNFFICLESSTNSHRNRVTCWAIMGIGISKDKETVVNAEL